MIEGSLELFEALQRSKAVGKYSSSGPDWIDVESLMRAIGSLHSGHVELRLQPNGNGLNGGVELTLSMHFDVLPGSSLPAVVEAKSAYPCPDCNDLATHVFGGLYKLDHEIGRVYGNSALWQE